MDEEHLNLIIGNMQLSTKERYPHVKTCALIRSLNNEGRITVSLCRVQYYTNQVRDALIEQSIFYLLCNKKLSRY